MKICLILLFILNSALASAQLRLVAVGSITDSLAESSFDVPLMTETADATKNSFRKHNLLIYPTRTATVINVILTSETKANYTGEFYDIKGNMLRKVILDAIHNEINLKDLESGTYLFRVFSSGKPETETNIVVDKSSDP